MKKICVLSAIALFASAASAQGRPNASDIAFPQILKTTETHTKLSTPSSAVPMSAPASSISEIAGEYVWSYYGLLEDDEDWQTAIVNIIVTDAETGEVAISGMIPEKSGIQSPLLVHAKVNMAEGTMKIPNNQNIGEDKFGYPNYFYFKTFDEQGYMADGMWDIDSITGTIEGFTISFPPECIFAVGDYNDEDMGWWKRTAVNEFTLYVEPKDDIDLSEWSTIGEATMYDGWILPGVKDSYGVYYNADDYPLTVNIARNKQNYNLLLIENPYLKSSGFPLPGADGFIILDVTDPEFVLVNPNIYSGYQHNENFICCTNIEGFYLSRGADKQMVKDYYGDEITEWSTCKVDGEGNVVIEIPTCCFQQYPDLSNSFTWKNRSEWMVAQISYKDKPAGIGNVVVEESDANEPAEYFNIQGMRIDNPAKGQLVIMRRGNKATKMIAK